MVGPTFALRNDSNVFQQAFDSAEPIAEMSLDCVAFMFGFDDAASMFAMTTSDKYIRLAPPPPGAGVPEAYYQYAPGDWRRAQNQRMINDRALYVVPSFFAYYQVFAAAANLPFDFGQVYVYPNPAHGAESPTLHVEVGMADRVSTRIYDVSGDLVFEGRLEGSPTVQDGIAAYEIHLHSADFRSGVYVGVVTAERAGKDTIRRQYRFTIVK